MCACVCYWVFVTIYSVCMYLSVSKVMCVRVCVLLGVCYYIYCVYVSISE